MEKKYQIFISSTYEDLKDARQEAMQAVLDLDHFPVGMEYFPAANATQWKYITELIDQCDYYIVIIAGRYGSQDENGVSYTQKEYEYALNKGIPTIAFIHSNIEVLQASSVEKKESAAKKLSEFKKALQNKLCRQWTTKDDLRASIVVSLTKLIKTDPRPGWVRSDSIADIEATREIIKLRSKIDDLNSQLQQYKLDHDSLLTDLAQGDDELILKYKASYSNRDYNYGHDSKNIRHSLTYKTTWNTVFSSFAFDLKSPVQDTKIKTDIERLIRQTAQKNISNENDELYTLSSLTIELVTVHKILNQLLALGYITVETIEHKDKFTKLYSLTPKGDQYLLCSCAVKKGGSASD